MSEAHYQDHDTQPIKLPRLRRESFQELPPPVSPWSAEASSAYKASIFDEVDPGDPLSIRHFESLAIGEQLHIPSSVLDDEGNIVPGSIYLGNYRVKSLSSSEEGLLAVLTTSAGIERVIPAKIAAKNHEIDFEVELNRSLAKITGVDIHETSKIIVEDSLDK